MNWPTMSLSRHRSPYRKSILAAAVALLGAATAVLPAGPAAAAPDPCTASVKLTRWHGGSSPAPGDVRLHTGAVANFTLTNHTITGITDFRAYFQTPKVSRVPNRWGQRLTYTVAYPRVSFWSVRPHGGNLNLDPPVLPEDPKLPPGRTIEFGFQAEVEGQIAQTPPETFITEFHLEGHFCRMVFV